MFIFQSMRTPALLVSFLIVNYILQEIFQLIGLDGVAGESNTVASDSTQDEEEVKWSAGIFSSIVLVLVLTLGLWVYSRYSG